MTILISTALISTIMLDSPKRCDSPKGRDSPKRRSSEGGKGGDTLWNGCQHFEEIRTSDSIGNTQETIRKSTDNDVPKVRDQQESSPCKTNDARSLLLQNEKRGLATQGLAKSHKSASQPNIPVETTGDSRGRRPEKSRQPTLASPGPTEPEASEELAHMHTKVEENHQGGIGPVEYQVEHSVNSGQVGTRIGSLNASAVRSLVTGSLGSLRRRKPQPWPNIQESLGKMIATKNKKIKGKVWFAEGEAFKLFNEKIRPEIESLLDNIEPPQCAPLFLTLYIIGKEEISASPIIMISCCDRKVRKDAEATIRESDILQRFPRMGLGNSAMPLETETCLIPTTGGSSETHGLTQSPPSREIHGSEEPVIGRRLTLVEKAGGRETVRFATGGPFVLIGNHVFQLTAFHIGQGYAGSSSAAQVDSSLDDCEYDGQSDTESEDGTDLDETTAKDTPPKESENTALGSGSTSVSRENHEIDALSETSGRQGPRSPRALLSRSDMDYFLVRLPVAEASKASNTIRNFGNRNSLQVADICELPESCTQVVVVTAYALLTGTILPGLKRVKMQGFHGFQDMIAARLSCSIRPGDSGSAVVDARTGCLYGHVILGSAPDTIVYIVPSFKTFNDVAAMLGTFPALNLDRLQRPPTPDTDPVSNIEASSTSAETGKKRKAEAAGTNGATADEEPAEKKQKQGVVGKVIGRVADMNKKTKGGFEKDNVPTRKASKKGKKEAAPAPVGRTARKTRSQGSAD